MFHYGRKCEAILSDTLDRGDGTGGVLAFKNRLNDISTVMRQMNETRFIFFHIHHKRWSLDTNGKGHRVFYKYIKSQSLKDFIDNNPIWKFSDGETIDERKSNKNNENNSNETKK